MYINVYGTLKKKYTSSKYVKVTAVDINSGPKAVNKYNHPLSMYVKSAKCG